MVTVRPYQKERPMSDRPVGVTIVLGDGHRGAAKAQFVIG